MGRGSEDHQVFWHLVVVISVMTHPVRATRGQMWDVADHFPTFLCLIDYTQTFLCLTFQELWYTNFFVSRKIIAKKHYLIMFINFGNIMIAGRLPLPSRKVIIMCCSFRSFKIRTALAFGMPDRLIKSAVLKIGASKIVSSA